MSLILFKFSIILLLRKEEHASRKTKIKYNIIPPSSNFMNGGLIRIIVVHLNCFVPRVTNGSTGILLRLYWSLSLIYVPNGLSFRFFFFFNIGKGYRILSLLTFSYLTINYFSRPAKTSFFCLSCGKNIWNKVIYFVCLYHGVLNSFCKLRNMKVNTNSFENF